MTSWRSEIELLQSAAVNMRVTHDVGHPRHEMWKQLSRWLERIAEETESYNMSNLDAPVQVNRHALTVAEEYLKAAEAADRSE